MRRRSRRPEDGQERPSAAENAEESRLVPEETPAEAADREGFTEPAVNFMPDCSAFCLMRTTDGLGPGPTYWPRSAARS